MPKFTLHGGWIGGWNTTGRVEIEGVTIEDVCNKFMEGVGDESIDTDYRSYDPGDTFVEFAWDEDGKALPVPKEYQEHGRWLAERDELLNVIEHMLNGYLEMVDQAGIKVTAPLADSYACRAIQALAKIHGDDDLILVQFFDDAFSIERDSFITLGAFFRVNEDGFDEDRKIMIREELKATGRAAGDEGAGGTWRIEVIR